MAFSLIPNEFIVETELKLDLKNLQKIRDGILDENNFWFPNENYGYFTIILPYPIEIDGIKFYAKTWLKATNFYFKIEEKNSDGSFTEICHKEILIGEWSEGMQPIETLWFPKKLYSVIKLSYYQPQNIDRVIAMGELFIHGDKLF